MMISVKAPLLADSSAPQRHARAWACGDRSWDTIQEYGPPGAPWKLAMFASNRVGDMDGVLVVPRAIEEEPVARA
jgi:hypothetical protein